MVVSESTRVREVLSRVPGAREVLERYGMAGCGGRQGPDEPLEVFARAHGVEPAALIRELTQAAAGPARPQSPAPSGGLVRPEARKPARPEPAEPAESYRYYLRAAVLIGALAGAALGAVNLTWIAVWGFTGVMPAWSWWPALVQAHGNAQLYGWCGLFVMGIASHSLPRMLRKPPMRAWRATAIFGLVLAGLLLGLMAQPLAAAHPWGLLFVLSMALQWAGVSLFAGFLFRTVGVPREPSPAFVWAGTAWFWSGATLRLALAVGAVRSGAATPDAALNAAYLHLMTWGFLVSYVLGYSLRLLPAFVGLPAPKARACWISLGLLVASTATGAAGAALRNEPLGFASALLALCGIAAAVGALRLWSPALSPGDAEGAWLLRFARTAYFWLAAAGLILAGLRGAEWAGPVSALHQHALGGAARHALTVGFVSLMIVGVAWRILPIFSGAERAQPHLVPLVFGVLVAGNTLRVVGQIGAGLWGGGWYPLMGISGWLETFALLVFALDVLRLLRRIPEGAALPDAGPAVELSWEAPVGPLVAHRPWLVPVFARYGMDQVTNPLFQRTVGKRVTLAQACRRFQAPEEQFMAELRAADEAARPQDAS